MQQHHKETAAEHIKHLSEYAQQILARNEPEDIHRFRVTYKKLRALLRMFEAERSLEELKKAYKAAGSVRDLQILRNGAEEYMGNSGIAGGVYIALLSAAIEKGLDELRDVVKDLHFDKIERKVLNLIPVKFTARQFTGFVKEKVLAAYEVSLDEPDNDDLHTTRKCLKEILYNLNQADMPGIALPLQEHKKNIDKMTDVLGKYNDTCNTLDLIGDARNLQLPDEEKEILQNLKFRLLRQKAEQKAGLMKKLDKFRSGVPDSFFDK